LPLAHSLTPGGPDIELLVFAGVLLVAAGYLFIRGAIKPQMSLLMVLGAIALGAGAFALTSSPAGSPGAEISIAAPPNGEVVEAGKQVDLNIDLQGGTLAASPSSDDGGHFHIFVDDSLVSMPGSSTPSVRLKRGTHMVGVEYVDGNHASYKPQILAQIELIAR